MACFSSVARKSIFFFITKEMSISNTNTNLFGNIRNRTPFTGDPVYPQDFITLEYFEQHGSGATEWKDSVIRKDFATPPGSPANEDRYIIASTATGAWVGKENWITQWNSSGAEWIFEGPPATGWATIVDIESSIYVFNGSSWTNMGLFPTPNHNDTGAIQGGVSSEYYHLTNSQHARASTLDQDLKTSDAVSFASVNGRDIAADGIVLDTLDAKIDQSVKIADAVTFLSVNGRDISTDGSTLDTLNTTLGGITVAESNQIQNIDSVTIDNFQWTALGDVTQAEINLKNSDKSTSILSGGLITADNPGVASTYSISDGMASFFINDVLTEISWTGLSGITPVNIATQNVTYVGILATGNIVEQAGDFTREQTRNIVKIGVVVHVDNTTVQATDQEQQYGKSPFNQVNDVGFALGGLNMSGNIYSANGTNMNIDKTSGDIFKMGVGYATTPNNPNIKTLIGGTAISFNYQDSLGTNYASTTEITPAVWDNNGVLDVVGNTNWSVQRMYVFPAGNTVIMYGQEEYSSRNNALDGIASEQIVVPESVVNNGILRCYLVVRGSTTDLSNTARATFTAAPKFGSGVGGSIASTTTTLQQAYDNSSAPQITTDATRGALQIQRGSAADTDKVCEILNGAGDTTFSVQGNGEVTTEERVRLMRTTGPNYVDFNRNEDFNIRAIQPDDLNETVVLNASSTTGDLTLTPVSQNVNLNGSLTVCVDASFDPAARVENNFIVADNSGNRRLRMLTTDNDKIRTEIRLVDDGNTIGEIEMYTNNGGSSTDPQRALLVTQQGGIHVGSTTAPTGADGQITCNSIKVVGEMSNGTEYLNNTNVNVSAFGTTIIRTDDSVSHAGAAIPDGSWAGQEKTIMVYIGSGDWDITFNAVTGPGYHIWGPVTYGILKLIWFDDNTNSGWYQTLHE